MLLRLSEITCRFAERTVLRGVNLTVNEGEVLLLGGGNGAGKSTLLRIMAGLLRPQAGRVDRVCEAEAIAYLGHATFLYTGLSALENLDFWQQSQGCGLTRSELEALLERVGLAAFADEAAGGFSRGMAQRLNLARVLAQRPRLLLLDEPGTGLDTEARALLQREITAARDRGAGVVWVSHDLAGDRRLADRLVLLAGKQLRFDGPASQAPLDLLAPQALPPFPPVLFEADTASAPATSVPMRAAGPPAGGTAC